MADQQLSVPTNETTSLSLLKQYNVEDDFASMRSRDVVLPTARIMQMLSPEVVQGKAAHGDMVDKSTANILFKAKTEKHAIVPFMMWLEWIEWNKVKTCPKNERIIERTTDPSSKLAKRSEAWETWKNNEGKEIPVVTEYYNFIVAFVTEDYANYDDLYLLGFARSSHKIGKMWLNRMRKNKIKLDGEYITPPMCAMRWAFKTAMVSNEAGQPYWIPSFGDGFQNPSGDLQRLISISNSLKEQRKEIMERNTNKETDEEVHPTTVAANTEM